MPSEAKVGLEILFFSSRLPLIQVFKVAIFKFILLYKGLVSYEILWWYEIHVTHTNFLDKIRNLIVLMDLPKSEYGFRSILKDSIDVP